MHHALVVEEDTVWIQASGVVFHVMGYLVKSRTWRGLGVVVIFVVGLGVVLCISFAIFCFVIDLHA